MSVYGTPAVKIILNTTDPSGSFILNQYAGPQTGNFWVTGKGRVDTKLGVGGIDPTYALHVVTADPIAASFSGRVIGANAVNPNEFITKVQLDTAIAGTGSVTSFSFTNANGFAGSVATPTTTPNLSITTMLNVGAVPFIGAGGALLEDPAVFFWDNTNKRHGIGTNAPIFRLHVAGTTHGHNVFTSSASGGYASYFHNVATIPGGMVFASGMTWAGGISVNRMQFAGSVSPVHGAILAGHTASSVAEFLAPGITVTMGQSMGVRAMAGLQILMQTGGANTGTISHGASLLIQGVYPATSSVINFQNYYAVLINQLDEWGVATFGNRWGIYQHGTADPNYLGSRLQIGNTTNQGTYNLQVTGGVYANVTGATMRFVGLPTDNTALQVLGKNAAGDNVWRDGTSIVAAPPYLQSTQIAYGSGSNVMTSSVALTYYNGTVTVAPTLTSGAFRTQSTIIQSTGTGLGWYGHNVFYNSYFRNYDVGAGGVLAFSGTEFHIRMFPSFGAPDNNLTTSIGTFAQYKTDSSGIFAIGGQIPIAPGNVTGASISGDVSGNITINTIANDNTKTALMVWDTTDKIVRWRSVASLPFLTAITADNGISATTISNVQLGSTVTTGAPFLHDTYLYAGTAYELGLSGSKAGTAGIFQISSTGGSPGLNVVTTGGGAGSIALTAINNTGTAIKGTSNGGLVGIMAVNTTGTALNAQVSTGLPLELIASNATVGSHQMIRIRRMASAGTPGVGFGGHIQLDMNSATIPDREAMIIAAVWTDPVDATRTSEVIIQAAGSPALATVAGFLGTGRVRFAKYGIGNMTGVAAYQLAVDSTGKIIEISTAPSSILPHTLLSSAHTDTVASLPVRGGLIYANGTPAWAQLAKGTIDQILQSNATDVVWVTISGGVTMVGGVITIKKQMSIDSDALGLKLVNDVEIPGNAKYYGTGSTGTKGFYDLPTSIVEGEWNFSTSVVMTDPGSGKFRTDQITFAASTTMVISDISAQGIDRTPILQAIQPNDLIYIQDKSNAGNWVRYRVTGPPVDNTTYWTIPVVSIEIGGILPTNNTPCLFHFTGQPSAGAMGITQLTTDVLAGPGSGVQVATIAANAVTYAKMQDVTATARFIGRISAGAGDPEELTGVQATTLLSLFATNATTKGLVPGSNNAGATAYLNATGSWTTVAGGDVTGAALTKTDDTNVTLTLGGTPATALLRATSITVGWTGTLGPTRGGTGIGTYATGDTLYASAANVLSKLTGNITTAKQFLSQTGSGAASAAPVWATIVPANLSMATARILGRVTAGTGAVEELTGTQATTLLDLFSTTTTTKGVVPGSNAVGSTFFLRADGVWAVPPGSGGGGYTTLTQFVDETAWRLFYSNAAGDVTPLAFGTNGQVLQSTGATSAPIWGAGGGGGTIGGSLAATQVAYGSAANTITGSADFIFSGGQLTLNKLTGTNLQLGTIATGISTDTSLSMGGLRATVAGSTVKLALYDDGTQKLGFGISAAELNYIVPAACSHGFYIGGVLMVAVLETFVGIKANNYLAFGTSITEKIRLYDGGSTASHSAIGMGASWVYYNVALTGSHRFTIGSTSVFEVASSTGYTTRTAVQSLTDIGSLIILPASYSSNAIEIRNSGGVTFQVDVNGSITTSSSIYATRLGIDKLGSNLPGVWLGDNVATATAYNFTLLRSDKYTQLNATGTGGRILFSRDNNVAANNIMLFTENHTLAIGWLYNTSIAEFPRMLNVAGGDAETAIFPIARLYRWTGIPAPTAGVTGGGIEFTMHTQANAVNIEIGSVIASVVTNVGVGTEAFDFVIYNMAGGATATETFRSKSTGEIAVQTLTQNDALTKVAVWDDTSKLIKWRLASTLTGGSGTIMGSLAATQVAYGSAANTITGSNDFNFVAGKLTLSKTTGTNLQLGDLVSLGTTTPVNINLGASYSTVAGANPKLIIHSDGYGIGISAAGTSIQEYLVPAGVWHRFYVGGVWKFHVDSAIIAVPNDVRISLQQGFGERITMYEAGGVTAGNYCFGVDSGTLWYNVSTGGKHDMRVNAVSIFQVHGAGATAPGVGIESERWGLNSTAAGDYSVSLGRYAQADNRSAIAIGNAAVASGYETIVIGRGINTTAYNSVVIGYGAMVSNGSGNGTAVGFGAQAGHYGAAIGPIANALGSINIALGTQSVANGNQSLAVGYGATSNGNNSIAIGTGSQSNGVYTIAIGVTPVANYNYSYVIGDNISTTATNQIVIGSASAPHLSMYGGNGVTSATPAAFYISATAANGTDIAASNLILRAGQSSGTAVPGAIQLMTGDPIASSAGLQGFTTKLTVGQYGIQPYLYYSSTHPAGGAAGYMLYNNYYNAMALHNGTQWNWMLTGGNNSSSINSVLNADNGITMKWDIYGLVKWGLRLGSGYSWSGDIGGSPIVRHTYIATNGFPVGFGRDEGMVGANFNDVGLVLGSTAPFIPVQPVLKVGSFNFYGVKANVYNTYVDGVASEYAYFYHPAINVGTSFASLRMEISPHADSPVTIYTPVVPQINIDIVNKTNVDTTAIGGAPPARFDSIGIRINSYASGTNTAMDPPLWHYAIQSLAGRNYMGDGIEFGSKTVDTTYLANVGTMIYRSDTGKFRGYNGTVWKNIAYETGNGAWKVFYTDAAGTTTELAIGAAGLVLTSNGAAAAPSWVAPPGAGGGGTPGLPDTSVQYNGAGSFAGSADMTFASGTLSLNKTTGINLQLGTNVAVNVSPVAINLGGSYANSANKLIIHHDGTYQFGIGFNVTGAQAGLEFNTGYLNSFHRFNTGGIARFTVADYGASLVGTLYFPTSVGEKIVLYDGGGGPSVNHSISRIAGATEHGVPGDSSFNFRKAFTTFLQLGAAPADMYLYGMTQTVPVFLIDLQASQTAAAMQIRNSALTTIASINNVGGAYFTSLKLETITQDDALTNVLVWDSAGKLVKYRASSTLGSAGSFWNLGGNALAAASSIGSTTNFDVSFKRNNLNAITLLDFTANNKPAVIRLDRQNELYNFPVPSSTTTIEIQSGSYNAGPTAMLDIIVANSGLRMATLSVFGTDDHFLEMVPANTFRLGGFAVFEAWGYGGLRLGSGNGGNAIYFDIHRTNAALINASGRLIINNSSDLGDYKLQVTGGLYVDATGKIVKLVGLSTDNTATQVAGKDATGNVVWRDVSSISAGGGSTKFGKAGEDAVAAENRFFDLSNWKLVIGRNALTTNGVLFQDGLLNAKFNDGDGYEGNNTTQPYSFYFNTQETGVTYSRISGYYDFMDINSVRNGNKAISINFEPSSTDSSAKLDLSHTNGLGANTYGTQVKLRYDGLYLQATAAPNAGIYKGIKVNLSGDLLLDNYPNSRADAATSKALYVDASGNLKYGPIAGGGGGVSSFAFTDANGFTGSVATSTTTPTLTLTTTLLTGSVPFGGTAGALFQDNATFFWDTANKRLGIGNAAPLYRLQVTGSVYAVNNFAHNVQGGWAAFLSNTTQVPAASSFTSGYTWAGGASSNTMQFGGSSTIAHGAIVAGHTSSNRIEFTAAGATITMTQATGIRAMAGLQILSQIVGGTSGTVTHGASLMIQGVYPNGAGVVNFNNYYGIVINPLDEWGVVTFTNRWAIYQQGANDPSYFASRIQIGNVSNLSTTNMLEVTGGFYVNATTATMQFVGLATDNTATQVLAKNASNNNVWRDVSSISGGGGGMADPTANGWMVRTALNVSAARTFTGTTNRLTISNPDGTAGNPVFDVGANIIDRSVANTYFSGAKQTFQHNATNAGFSLGSSGGNPSTGVNGDMWYDGSANIFRGYSNGNRDIITHNDTQTISNKTLDNTNIITVKDFTSFVLQNATDITKQIRFSLTNITTGNTRDIFFPNVSTILVGEDSVQRLSNKRIDPRTDTVTSSTSLTINSDAVDLYTVTALAATMVMNNPSGTPIGGQKLMIRIKDNGTTRTLTWSGTQWRIGDVTLPIATVPNKTMYLGFIWNSVDSKWDFISYMDNF